MDPRFPARLRLAAFLALAALALSGCADEGLLARPDAPEPALGRRVVVLPFSDSQDRGAEIAGDLSRQLAAQGWDPVDSVQLRQAAAAIGYQPGEELGPSSLADLRSITLADDVVTGSMDSSWDQALVVVSDARSGRVVFRRLVWPSRADFQDPPEVSRSCAQALADWTEAQQQTVASLPDPD